MSEINKKYTISQQNAISLPGNMLVSASAGTGKTTVMIERIASLIENGADVSELVVVTFTNLAAAEMKARLALRLAQSSNNPHIVEQLEKLDSASICTLHSFCSELLRNYFYVVDIDPAFSILDDATVANLKRNALDDVFAEYFDADDDDFMRVYKIFATGRKEDNFRNLLMRVYSFSRCIEDFGEWYNSKKENYLQYSEDNPFVKILLNDIAQSVRYWKTNMTDIIARSSEEELAYTSVFERNAELLEKIRLDTLNNALNDLCKLQLEQMPGKVRNVPFTEAEQQIRNHFGEIEDEVEEMVAKYSRLSRGQSMQTLWQEMRETLLYTDKLVEILDRFEVKYFEAKKQRGGVDYDDLEHMCLKLLCDEATLGEIRQRYKLIFVDEYQDTNPVQEAIVSRLAAGNTLFMVGDIKQSIYGFRGCEPSIFLGKYNTYKAADSSGHVEELNDNFRSNSEILDFVNDVFNRVMTSGFGKVDYRGTAQLNGATPPQLKTFSTRIDYLIADKKKSNTIEQMYDITAPVEERDKVSQGELIARRIKEYVGMAYYTKDGDGNRVEKRIQYGDVVILMRGLRDKAADIYNTLVAHNIPVAANFKVDGLATKEVRELVNLFRVVDNPYDDVSFVGVILSVFGGFTEAELGHIRLDTAERDEPFYERLQKYAKNGKKRDLGLKIGTFLSFVDGLRFYSRSACVDEVALKVLKETNYHLYVQGLPNGALRLRKLYAFIDGLKGAPYAQSIDKFLAYIDDTDNRRPEEGASLSNAVRLMTMHASKGLEFPVVILAGLESRFQFDRYAVGQSFDLGLATRYYNFDNMRVAETFSETACDLSNKNKQREEELRLLYVAMTRAKFVLNIVATVTPSQLNGLAKLPSKATSHLDWLMCATKDMLKTGRLTRGLEINEVKDGEQSDEQVMQTDLKCKQSTDIAAIEKQLGFVYPYLNETRMPPKIVSSALDKAYIDTTDEPQAEFILNPDPERNEVGTAYHRLYQYLPLHPTAQQISQTIHELVSGGKIEQRFADKINTQLVLDTLNNPKLLELMSDGKVYHEIPFMLSAPYSQLADDKQYNDEVMLQGVIDLLVIKQNSAVVVDFKYTSRSDLVHKHYSKQLHSYKLAVKQICGIEDVQAYILSIADNKLIKM